MPASEYSWETGQQFPVFQVCTSKRKCDQGFLIGNQEEGQLTQKRLCLSLQPELVDKSTMEMSHGVPDHHVTQFQHEQNQMQAMCIDHVGGSKSQAHVVPSQSWPDVHTPMSDTCAPLEMNNNCPGSMPDSNTGFLMNLDDETYSSPPHHQERLEQQEACASMDGDFVPDQRQYDPHGEFCKEYCGFGSVSPRSGKVRCYCKPSWEGMLEVRPYISDVY